MEKNKYCKYLKTIPKEEGKYSMENYFCKITCQSCVGEVTHEINLQPSHYCPEDMFVYDNSLAKSKCPAYNVPKNLAKEIIKFRNTLILEDSL